MEKGVARSHYGPERIDAYFGAVFSNLMSVSMIIATAATLYVVGQREIGSAGTQLARSSRWWKRSPNTFRNWIIGSDVVGRRRPAPRNCLCS